MLSVVGELAGELSCCSGERGTLKSGSKKWGNRGPTDGMASWPTTWETWERTKNTIRDVNTGR